MKSKKNTNYHHGDLKTALISAALKVIKEEGYRSLSLRRVASEAGVSPAAPYRHYPDSETLISEIAREGFRLLAVKLKESTSKKPDDPLWQFRESGIAYVEFALDNKELFRIMYGHFIENHSDHEALRKEGESAFKILEKILIHCQEQNLIVKSDPEEIALAAWSMVHGIATLIVEKQMSFESYERKNTRKTIAKLMRYIYTGMQVVNGAKTGKKTVSKKKKM